MIFFFSHKELAVHCTVYSVHTVNQFVYLGSIKKWDPSLQSDPFPVNEGQDPHNGYKIAIFDEL